MAAPITTETLAALVRKNGEEFDTTAPLEVWITLRGYRFQVLAASVTEGDSLDLEISDISEERGAPNYNVARLVLGDPEDGSDAYNPGLDIRAIRETEGADLPHWEG